MELSYKSLSVREAVRYVFPYVHQATINGWIKKGVFMPETYVPAPAMRGRGSKLSISDRHSRVSRVSSGLEYFDARGSGKRLARRHNTLF